MKLLIGGFLYNVMETNFISFKNGVKNGIPIFIGYLAVSFSFGIAAKNIGLSVFQGAFMSASNLTSAGQFASLGLIAAASSYFEMAVTQFVINLRYCLMSCALSQKLSESTAFFHRFIMAAGISDEIFGISYSAEGHLNPFYTYGLMTAAVPGWVLGTILGIASGNILPDRIMSSLSIALYSMFIAVIIPPTRKNKILKGIVILSMLLSFIFYYIPVLNNLSQGFKIIILTAVIAGGAAVLFPIKEE